jgi:hypothetical protein
LEGMRMRVLYLRLGCQCVACTSPVATFVPSVHAKASGPQPRHRPWLPP